MFLKDIADANKRILALLFLWAVITNPSFSYGGVEGGAAGFDYSAEDGVKTEGEHAHAAAMMEVDRAAASFGVEQGCFLSTRNPNYSCGFPDPSSSATGHFLGQSVGPRFNQVPKSVPNSLCKIIIQKRPKWQFVHRCLSKKKL